MESRHGYAGENWEDSWIPGLEQGTVASPRVESVVWVSDLMFTGERGWNLDLIDSIFLPDEAFLIKCIPMSVYDQEEKVVWRSTFRTVVGINCRLLTMLVRRRNASCMRGDCPPKVRIALWRACKFYLPTKHLLFW